MSPIVFRPPRSSPTINFAPSVLGFIASTAGHRSSARIATASDHAPATAAVTANCDRPRHAPSRVVIEHVHQLKLFVPAVVHNLVRLSVITLTACGRLHRFVTFRFSTPRPSSVSPINRYPHRPVPASQTAHRVPSRQQPRPDSDNDYFRLSAIMV